MLKDSSNYEPTDASIWQGRKDSLPRERFFQCIHSIDLQTQSLKKTQDGTAILGFCSDEGIRRNEGRIGAKLGPLHLRQQLAKLACYYPFPLVDLGNIVCNPNQLEIAQDQFARLVHHAHQQGYKTVALGGGHEIAWGHFLGLAPHYSKLAIINFDAHFDLRPGCATSGTSFRQIAEYCLNNRTFHYCCLGIQEVANTKSLFSIAKELNVAYLSAERMNQENLAWQLDFINRFIINHDAIYLTVCLDVFSECLAPGVSAPQALGLTAWQALPLLKSILQTGKVVGLDVAELSPPLDQEQKTERFAAHLLAEMLNYCKE